jgi:hypothetical protein
LQPPNGANCHACHQLQPKELSFGNIGPSLYQYGKLRGTGDAVLKYMGQDLQLPTRSTPARMPSWRCGHPDAAADAACHGAVDGSCLSGQRWFRAAAVSIFMSM